MQPRNRRYLGNLVVLLVLVGSTHTKPTLGEVTGDTQRVAARSLGSEGLTAFEAGDYATALDRLNRAFLLHPVPTLALWSGRAMAKSGKLVAASERLLQATRLTTTGGLEDTQLAAQRDAEAERQAILARLPALRIALHADCPDPLKLTIDGAEIPIAALGSELPLDPGEHIVVVAWHDRSSTAQVTLAEREHKAIEVGAVSQAIPGATVRRELSAPTAATPTEVRRTGQMQRTIGWAVLGVGAASLATWGVTGLVAMGKRAELNDHCPNGDCPPEYHNNLASYGTYRTVSTVGFVVGALGVGAGTALLVFSPRVSNDQAVTPRLRGVVGINGIWIEGSY